MTVNAASGINTANSSVTGTQTANTTGGSSAAATSNPTFLESLQLFTTELKDQDPTDAMSTSDMTQQLASITELQSQISTNTALQNVAAQMQAGQINTSASLIGTEVTTAGNTMNYTSGQSAIGSYTLSSAAQNVTVTVTNSSGAAVYSNTIGGSTGGGTAAGQNSFTWGGQTTAGGTAPSGTYTFSVTATDANGNPVTATTATTGIVQDVSIAKGVVTLNFVGGGSALLSSVTSIGANPLSTQSSSGQSSSGT